MASSDGEEDDTGCFPAPMTDSATDEKRRLGGAVACVTYGSSGGKFTLAVGPPKLRF